MNVARRVARPVGISRRSGASLGNGDVGRVIISPCAVVGERRYSARSRARQSWEPPSSEVACTVSGERANNALEQAVGARAALFAPPAAQRERSPCSGKNTKDHAWLG